MAYRIEYRSEVNEDLDILPSTAAARVRTAEKGRLETEPTKYGEQLRKTLAGLWRIRVGDYRVAYTVDEGARLVTVWAVRHRKEIYPELTRRWMRR